MTAENLTTGLDPIKDAAKAYFRGIYHVQNVILDSEVDAKLNWKPSIQLKVNEHLTIIAEVSEKPYPLIISLRRPDVENLPQPISVYSVCPEEAYLADQAEAKRLMAHGYGLLTVDAAGAVQVRASCIPVIQIISQETFQDEIKGLPAKLKTRLAEAYQRYVHNAPSGSTDISEVLEGLVTRAGKEAVGKKWIAKSDTRTVAKTLDAMMAAPDCHNAIGALAAARGYIYVYRNANHHFPKNKAQAAKKYKECRHSFLDGLKKVRHFRDAMRNLGLTGGL